MRRLGRFLPDDVPLRGGSGVVSADESSASDKYNRVTGTRCATGVPKLQRVKPRYDWCTDFILLYQKYITIPDIR